MLKILFMRLKRLERHLQVVQAVLLHEPAALFHGLRAGHYGHSDSTSHW